MRQSESMRQSVSNMERDTMRQSIVDNGELFTYLQSQYNEAPRPSAKQATSFTPVEEKHILSLEEKIKLRKSKLQEGKAKPDARANLDISELGDHQQDYNSPCFQHFQPVENNFMLDTSLPEFDYREIDTSVDVELRNHKAEIDSESDNVIKP